MQHRKLKAIVICVAIFMFYLFISYLIPDMLKAMPILVFGLVLTYRKIVNSAPFTLEEKKEDEEVKNIKNKLNNINDSNTLAKELIEIEDSSKYFYKENKLEIKSYIDAIIFSNNIDDEKTIKINAPKNITAPLLCVKCNNKIGLSYKSLEERKIICPKCSTTLIWGLPKQNK